MDMKTNNAYLGLDIGGTGVKASVFDRKGRMLGFSQQTYQPHISTQGHADIAIATIYEAARKTVLEAVGQGGVRITAMAVVSQGQTFVSLDDSDQPLHPAIIWYDGRAKKEAAELCKRVAGIAHSGPVPHIATIATAPKILWLRRHHSARMRRARRFLLLPDYFAYRLTGMAVTDPNTASSTALCAEGVNEYDSATLAAAGIDEQQLSRIQGCGTPISTLLPAVAGKWGLSAQTILVNGTNDQYAGALGSGNCRPRILSETTGTCQALVTLIKKVPRSKPPGLLFGRFPIGDYAFVLAYAKTAGVVLDWFRRELTPGCRFAELDRRAAAVPIGCRGLTAIPHFDGLVSPQTRPEMRGALLGLTLSHTRADVYRALLESLAFSLRENLEYLDRKGFGVDVIRCIGGGARNNLWLQMKADVTGRPVEKPFVTEAAVFGAAMLAAKGYGAFTSLAEASAAFYRCRKTFCPNSGHQKAYQEPYARYRRLKNKLLKTGE